MRILLTAVAGERSADLAVDCEDDATVADLASTLAAELPPEALAPAGRRHTGLDAPVEALTVVRAVPSTGPAAGTAGDGGAAAVALRDSGVNSAAANSSAANGAGPVQLLPRLYIGDRPIPPEQLLAESPIRHGALVGIGAPVPDVMAEPTGLVEVRIASGPGSGTVARFTPGEYLVGPCTSAGLRLPDVGLPQVCAELMVGVDGTVQIVPAPELVGLRQQPPPRQRPLPGPIVLSTGAEITERKAGESTYSELPPGVSTISPEDAAPVISLDREPLTEVAEWQIGQALVIGPCLLELVETGSADASLSPSPQGATLDYNRPPRLLPPERPTDFRLPNEPKRPEKQPIPWSMMMMPLVIGPLGYLMTGSLYSLMIMGAMPLMGVMNATTGRGRQKRKYKQEFADYVARTEDVQQRAFEALREERGARRRDLADPGEVLLTATGPRSRLWQRRRSDPDWLLARVGTADQRSAVTVQPGSGDSASQRPAPWTAPDVPVTVSLTESGVTGIAGPARYPMVRSLLGQVGVLHSPVEVRLVLLTEPEMEKQWSWARWLPHLRNPDETATLGTVGADEQTTQARIGDLLRELEARREAIQEGGGSAKALVPMIVVLDGSRRLRLLPGMVPLLQLGPSVGMYFVCLDEDYRLLPEECQAVVRADEPWSVVEVSTKETIEAVRPDLVSTGWAERMARAVAPVRDVSAEDAAAAIPTSSRLLTVIDLDPPTSESIQGRWQRIGRSTTAVIGEQADGVFAIDMVRDGPHGLVAGTTGSGKSELLQTIIGALAADNRPDEMTFVLIDYKGGAAFKDCNKLPHTVGMVTDLDGHLTTRALESLGAELRRREHQLADADAKDIEDYLAAKGPDDEPMPRLLIVIDEFAALVAELPDFVTGLVDIARRGRSLGVHLILATQRPAGVVSAEIKSNTNLRIALRVTDAGDSQDVIEARDAAHIAKSTPGRAYARLGHSSLIPFQSSRVGGRPRGEGRTAEVSLRPLALATLGAEPPATAQAEEDATTPTDLTALVQACQQASAASGVTAPPSPWLPALGSVLTLDEVLEQFPDTVPTRDRLQIPFGMIDIPSEQRRGAATYSLDGAGHLAIIGAPRTGRSSVLRAFAGAIGRFLSPEDVHVYGVDCGNNALLPLVSLPHVGAVVKRDETDRMDRLVAQLRRLISHRQQLLAEQGYADVAEQRKNVSPDQALPYVVILFDRWEGFYQAYDPLDGGRLVIAWQQILQEGAAAGVRIVMSGDRTMTIGRMSTMLDDKLMLRMVDPGDFLAVGMNAKQVPNSMPEGRAFRGDGPTETQVALLADDPVGTAQVAALHEIGRQAREKHAALPPQRRPFRVDVLPMRMPAADAADLAAREQEAGRGVPSTSLPIAVGGDTLSIRYLDAVDHGPAALITGPRRTGRSTTLLQLGRSAHERGWEVVVFTPRVSPLRSFATQQEGVHGPFDVSHDQAEVKELLDTLREGDKPMLVLADDLELIGAEGWVADTIVAQIQALRDTESLVVAAGSAAEMASQYRGPASLMKKAGSGLMLSPQSQQDADMFGAKLNRSLFGVSLPPGGGYFMGGGPADRIQVILPE